MTAQYRPVHRDMPILLPPDLREWVPEDDLVHVVIQAIEHMSFTANAFAVNHRGTGAKQYPPRRMLALRYLTGDTHPGHDMICDFRRRNQEAFCEAFLRVLKSARAMGVLKVGVVSVDGTHLDANAAKSKNVRYDRAAELEKQPRVDIDDLLRKAEAADADDAADGQTLPAELTRRERLLAKMQEAQANLQACAEAKAAAEREARMRIIAEYEARQKVRPRCDPPPRRYAKRKQTVQPVFGIIKAAMGFRKFHLRSLPRVSLEWTLMTLAYNVKWLYASLGRGMC